MRRLGLLTSKAAADQFAHHLESLGLEARRDQTAAGTEFWLYDEDRVEEIRKVLERYERGEFVPIDIPPPAPTPEVAAPRTTTPTAPRRPSRLATFSPEPWTVLICVLSIAATLLTGFFHVPTQFSRALAIIPLNVSAEGASWSPADDNPLLWVSRGEVWRLFTPALIHGHILHIIFNLQWFYVCASVVERIRGTWRLAGLTILSAGASNLAQYAWAGPMFCGLSGVGYALYGYVWMKSLLQPETRFHVPRSLHIMFWVWTLICFSGLLPIANGAHATGLAVGILYGLVTFL
ncbi:Rhomboid protease GlpG [Caulifigura coniformis]|uniref:Rhomboid protease GlpG n=1 Tax=Caulifigura coniformis TaxID=2527983 RepID=A0A517SGT3_9PLAN|nr:rhomboid family intramembrane serine protease [Caulifigura coniformis]QDT55334.1 Rhomboid protease GlpG [Caulifigura coniformis]